MAKGLIEFVIDRNDIAEVAKGFRQYELGLQKKYFYPAVRDAIKAKAPSLKGYTPRNKGKLRQAVGFIATKPKRRGNAKKYGIKVIGRIGYRRGRTISGKGKKGFHALLVSKGVKAQMPRGRAFRIEWAKNRKYSYLKSIRRRGDPNVFLFHKRKVRGQKFFETWWRGNKRPLMRIMKKNIQSALVKTKAEAARRVRQRQKKKAEALAAAAAP